jgi:hypothetical protein
MLDLRGAQYDDVVIERAVMRNSIDRNGQIVGLNMTADNSLVVRDDDGVVAPPPNIWLTPRPPIAVTVRDHFVMSSGSVLQLVFESDLWDSLISFQPAIPVDLGGILDLGFAPVVDIRSQIGRTIRLFDWTGVTPTGAFAIRSPYLWDTSQLYTTGEVTLLAIPEPASIVIVSTGIFGALVLRLRNPLFWTE